MGKWLLPQKWDVVTHACPNFIGSWAWLSLKSGDAWVIASHNNYIMQLIFHDKTSNKLRKWLCSQFRFCAGRSNSKKFGVLLGPHQMTQQNPHKIPETFLMRCFRWPTYICKLCSVLYRFTTKTIVGSHTDRDIVCIYEKVPTITAGIRRPVWAASELGFKPTTLHESEATWTSWSLHSSYNNWFMLSGTTSNIYITGPLWGEVHVWRVGISS